MKSLPIILALLSLHGTAGQPTSIRKQNSVSNSQDGASTIPLTKRGAKDLKLEDGSLDWNRAHVSQLRDQITRSLLNMLS